MLSKQNLIQTALQVGCTESQAEELWKLLPQEDSSKKGPHLLSPFYWLGGSIIFCALAWFLGEAAILYEKTSLFLILFTYVVMFYAIGLYLWKRKKNQTLGGMACFLSLSLVPMTTYAFQSMLGWWPGSNPGEYISFYSLIKGGWFLMEVTTLTLTWISLRFIRFPLVAIILYATLGCMSLDILPFFAQLLNTNISMELLRKGISILFGCCLMAQAFRLEKKNQKKEAFWAYLIGVFAFWNGITLINYQTEWGYAIYCLLNVLLLILGTLKKKKSFLCFGLLGILNYLGQLVIRHFSDSTAFPIVLSLIGVFIIVVGGFLHRYKKKRGAISQNHLNRV